MKKLDMNSLIKINKNFCEIRNNKLKSQLVSKGFGFNDNGVLKLDLFETFYLVENNKIKLELSKKDLQKICEKEIKDFNDKYLVFKDFRDKGYIIKDGAIFGFDFRIYEKSDKKHTHTKYVVDIKRTYKDTIIKVIKSERLANSINAKYILAIIDAENKIIKIKLERLI
ncbi:MAG: tRNA-intron lyase [archaeon]|jgi:tRNA-intron endonuclease|nr:tRNA-intron lyase [archaeon]MDD2477819.1 tRNA-intron lyase [Candidatus ainarchaeum sp.]MDD3084669.1 tRNA-intron lyase [Candidatus ainarchaeum sp.]MDD4221215.1 tRNA-intron lyase [Candidatus ainarchaeum sp.]MDD4662722.1 tRNA-intron lyase [Candidatus ainarchaeum sp.]